MYRLIILGLIACASIVPPVASAVEPRFAVRGEGYFGYSHLEVEDFEEDAWQGGGVGSAAVVSDPIYFQVDAFGDVMGFDEDDLELVGGGGHFGWRDALRGQAGVAGAYNHRVSGSGDVWRVGLEGELYFDRFTIGVQGGYIGDLIGDGYLIGLASFYPNEDSRIELVGGAAAVENADPYGIIGASGELFFGSHLSAFARWEASFLETFVDVAQHSVVGGLRLYFGADQPTLQGYDRAHLNRGCIGFLLAGRAC